MGTIVISANRDMKTGKRVQDQRKITLISIETESIQSIDQEELPEANIKLPGA